MVKYLFVKYTKTVGGVEEELHLLVKTKVGETISESVFNALNQVEASDGSNSEVCGLFQNDYGDVLWQMNSCVDVGAQLFDTLEKLFYSNSGILLGELSPEITKI